MANYASKYRITAILTAALISHFVVAYDPSQTTCPGSYPLTLNDHASNPALLLDNNDYNISWTTGPQISGTEPYTFRVVWKFPVSDRNSTVVAMWETNTTSSWISVRFNDIINTFPTNLATDVDSLTAGALAARNWENYIEVSIPGLPIDRAGNIPVALSQPFALHSASIGTYLDTWAASAQRDEYGRWRLGVGIGVGIGVPLLMAITGWAAWRRGKRSMPEKQDLGIEMAPK